MSEINLEYSSNILSPLPVRGMGQNSSVELAGAREAL
jgi:hypothetical protein